MATRLVICLDGTTNRPRSAETHVQRIFRVVARVPNLQIPYYQPGVGTLVPHGVYLRSRALLLKGLDAATAWMLQRHVGSAYHFLMQTWTPGDEVFVFGFSRGAYAARVLCGMLSSVGLLHTGMDEMLPFAWDEYRQFSKTGQKHNEQTAQRNAARFKKRYARAVPVHFLGLFDTVSSVGTPWRPSTFRRTATNRDVAIVRHALALDERRALFGANLWRGDGRGRQDVQQRWFAGVHGDVGGGYPETEAGLAKIPLAWMLREAKAAGLLTDEAREEALFPGSPPDDQGRIDDLLLRHAADVQHESLCGLWKFAEWLPLPRWQLVDGVWRRRWRPHRGRLRHVAADASIDASVHERIARLPGYRPGNLPQSGKPPV
ncbi:MAG: DUF2235 domain-containing protein [Tahibacter sp.]